MKTKSGEEQLAFLRNIENKDIDFTGLKYDLIVGNPPYG